MFACVLVLLLIDSLLYRLFAHLISFFGVSLFICLFVTSVCLFVCFCFCLFICLFVYLFDAFLFVSLHVVLFNSLFICLFFGLFLMFNNIVIYLDRFESKLFKNFQRFSVFCVSLSVSLFFSSAPVQITAKRHLLRH